MEHDPYCLAYLVLGQGQGIACGIRERCPGESIVRCLPRIADLTQPVQIVHGMAGSQHPLLCRRSGKYNFASRCVIDVFYGHGGRAGNALLSAKKVGIMTHHPYHVSHVVLGWCPCFSRGIGQGRPGGAIEGKLPCVGDLAQPIPIFQGVLCGQDAMLFCGSREGDRTGWRVIDLQYDVRGRAGDLFLGTEKVRMTGHDPDRGSHFILS